jgi:hypothetical protein
MSQKARKNAARTAATRARLREPFPAGALNAAIQGRKRRRRAVRSTTAQRARCANSAHAQRLNSSAFACLSLSAATRGRATMFILTGKAPVRLD